MTRVKGAPPLDYPYGPPPTLPPNKRNRAMLLVEKSDGIAVVTLNRP
jgi:hypothetical protein